MTDQNPLPLSRPVRVVTTLNATLLGSALDVLEARPEQFDDHAWATRTAAGEFYSLAARVCLLAGHTINWGRVNTAGNATFLTSGDAIPETAAQLLGLDTVDAHELFDVDLTLPRIRVVAERLITRARRGRGGRSIQPPGAGGEEFVVHMVSWTQWLLGDVLRLKIPRPLCGASLIGDVSEPDPADLGAPRCPRCAERAGYPPERAA